jgi:hypothetical protein
MRACSFLLAAALSAVCFAAPASVEIVRFHDEDRSSMAYRQILFASERRGMAIGSLLEDDRERPVISITSDGGASWTDSRLPEPAVSVYCLDDSACWLVTSGGVWFSEEAGRSWQRLSKEKLLRRIWFIDRNQGWAVGAGKKLLETHDGGRTWTKMAAAEQVKTTEDRTVFHSLCFISESRAIISGKVEPRRTGPLPFWMEENPELERETPTLSIVRESADAGKTWKASTTSMFGRISAVRSAERAPFAVALVEFDRFFEYPSELFRIDAKTGASARILRAKDFAITDVGVLPDRSVVAAGFEPAGSIARTPVPGRLRVMRSSDLAKWTPVDVDYRAVAQRVSVTVAPDGTVWMATDTGMLLRYHPLNP